MALAQKPLFDANVPDGFLHRDDFITQEEEASLAADISRVEFSNFEMRGVVARRRVAFFGRSYDTSAEALQRFPLYVVSGFSRTVWSA